MPDAKNSEQDSTPEPDAEFTNRAARRRRGKKRSAVDDTEAGAGALVRDTGRRYMGQGPRQWTVRHGG